MQLSLPTDFIIISSVFLIPWMCMMVKLKFFQLSFGLDSVIFLRFYLILSKFSCFFLLILKSSVPNSSLSIFHSIVIDIQHFTSMVSMEKWKWKWKFWINFLIVWLFELRTFGLLNQVYNTKIEKIIQNHHSQAKSLK